MKRAVFSENLILPQPIEVNCSYSPSSHRHPHLRRQPGVGQGAVQGDSGIGLSEEMFCDGFKAMVRQLGKTSAAELESTVVEIGKAETAAAEFVTQKGQVEGGIVGNQGGLSDEGVETWENGFKAG